jgi:hypothetical protein
MIDCAAHFAVRLKKTKVSHYADSLVSDGVGERAAQIARLTRLR